MENKLNNETAILNAIDKKKNDFMKSLLENNQTEITETEFNSLLKSRNKEGVFKELIQFLELDKKVKFNLILQGLLKENKTLTYKMIEENGSLKDFRDYLIKTNSKQQKGEFIIKSVIKDNTLFLYKSVRTSEIKTGDL